MEKLKLALVGCGKLNEIVAQAATDGVLASDYELVAVLEGHDKEKGRKFGECYHCSVVDTIDDLLAFKPDYTAEAASVQAVKDYAEAILAAGSHLVVLSIGAFADEAFYEHIQAVARQNKRRVHIASGAVGGFDVLRTARLMSPIEMSITSAKDPAVAAKMTFTREEIAAVEAPEVIFEGTTKEAIEKLPTQMNVAIATALASAGPVDTEIKIEVEPGFKGDRYKIVLEGEEVKTDLTIYSRTSAIAGWSVVATLQNAVSPIVF